MTRGLMHRAAALRQLRKQTNRVRLSMTSFRHFEANRRKALKSSGPRTQAGKERSRRNGLRHGRPER
jgi:hypothetical protein